MVVVVYIIDNQIATIVEPISVGNFATNTVKLLEKECSCGKYQQTGVPCLCAIAALKKLEKSPEEIFNTELYFHEHLSAKKLLETFNNAVYSYFPGDDEVNKFLNFTESLAVALKVNITKKSKVSYSKKRIRSTGIYKYSILNYL
jgi:hypothetical protein